MFRPDAYDPFTGPEHEGRPTCRTCGAAALKHEEGCIDLNVTVAETVFGWERYRIVEGVQADLVILAPPGHKPGSWEPTDLPPTYPEPFGRIPRYDCEWSDTMAIRDKMAADDQLWWRFNVHLMGFRGLHSTDWNELWRYATPRQVCRSALAALLDAKLHDAKLHEAGLRKPAKETLG